VPNLTLEDGRRRLVPPLTDDDVANLTAGDEVVLEVTRYTTPCFNIRPAFRGGDYSLVSQKRHPGRSRVYARVIATGMLHGGDPARLL